MAERTLRDDILWAPQDGTARYAWVGCARDPEPGHARQVYAHQLLDPLICLVCREPAFELSKRAVERYKAGDRRCEACRTDHHSGCTGVGCYGCPREFHRTVGVVATRTINGVVGQ